MPDNEMSPDPDVDPIAELEAARDADSEPQCQMFHSAAAIHRPAA